MGLRADFGLSRLLVILLVTYSVRPTRTLGTPSHAPTPTLSLSLALTRLMSLDPRLQVSALELNFLCLGCNPAPPTKTWQVLIRESLSRDLSLSTASAD